MFHCMVFRTMFLYCIFIYVFAQIVNGGTCHYFNANTFCCVEVITVPCHWLFVPILFCNDVSMREIGAGSGFFYLLDNILYTNTWEYIFF